MNKISKYTLLVLVGIILLGLAGRCEFNEEVIYNMPNDTYQVMRRELDNPSDNELVDEYLNNPQYWDSLAFDCIIKNR